MNVPTTNITMISRVVCFQCLEKIDVGDMVFDLKITYSNLHTILDGSVFVGIVLNGCSVRLASRNSMPRKVCGNRAV